MNEKIKVIKVSGGPYERSLQQAKMLGRGALSSSLDFYRRFWDIQAAHMVPGLPKWAQKSLIKVIKSLVVKPGARDKYLEPRDRELLQGYADGVDSAISYEELKQAAAAPDAYNYCLGFLFRTLNKGKLPLPPSIKGYAPVSGIGCSSMIAWGDATADNQLIYGRNLDFFTGDRWIDQAVLLVAEPGPGEIPFASVTSAGIPIEGITALNAEGLAVGVHQNFSTAVNTKGRSIISITNEVAACARSIGEAVDIVRKRHTVSGWTVIVGSARERNAVLIESNAQGTAIIEPGDNEWLCYANCYLSSAMQAREYTPGYAFHEHNHSRLARMRSLLTQHHGAITPSLMAVMLGDHYDPISERERPLGNTIAAVHNVTSAVMEADKQRIWIAQGPAPANTTAAYIGFDLDAIRRGEEGVLGSVPGHEYYNSPAYPGLREYTLAYQAFDDLQYKKVVSHLEKACTADPQEPIYAFMLGLFYLKEGKAEQAMEKFLHADQPFNSPYRKAAVCLWQARCCDLLERRSEAVKGYQWVVENTPPEFMLQASAKKGLKRPYKAGAVKNVVAEFLMGDAEEV